MPETFPARLHVLLARDAPVGMVIRRGPSRAVAVLRWDRREDSFHLGQWLRGRIYPLRSDISPDGRHAIYFAMNGRWGSGTGGSWTAISRAGWLKALVLWGKGDCWNGGGLFLDNRRYWLNDGPFGHREMESDKTFRRIETYQGKPWHGGECWGIYPLRLLRDGWEQVSAGQWQMHFRKPASGWILHKFCHAQIGAPQGKSIYWEEHLLEGPGGSTFAGPGWEWAETEPGGVVYAEAGCLWRRRFCPGGEIGGAELLRDFNSMRFEAIAAPYGN